MAKGTLALRQIKLGDNADTSKNFVISVPAVADGTLVIERENGTDVLTIDASGRVSFPNNPTGLFYAVPAASQGIPANAATTVAFNSEQMDSDGYYDAATSRFNPKTAGWYQINAAIVWPSLLAGVALFADIYLNGALFLRGERLVVGSAGIHTTLVNALVPFNGTTDYVEIRAFQSSAGVVNLTYSGNDLSYFQGHLVLRTA